MFFKWFLFYLIILGFLSLNPWVLPDPKQAIGFITWDLLDHSVAYSLLAVSMMLAFRARSLPLMISVVILSSLIGVLLEYGQYWFTSTRQFSFYDAIANIFGSVLGVGVFWGVRVCRKHLFWRYSTRLR